MHRGVSGLLMLLPWQRRRSGWSMEDVSWGELWASVNHFIGRNRSIVWRTDHAFSFFSLSKQRVLMFVLYLFFFHFWDECLQRGLLFIYLNKGMKRRLFFYAGRTKYKRIQLFEGCKRRVRSRLLESSQNKNKPRDQKGFQRRILKRSKLTLKGN